MAPTQSEIFEAINETLKTIGMPDNKVLHVIKTGSQIFIATPHDLDFIVVCDKVIKHTAGIKERARRHTQYKGFDFDFIFVTPSFLKKAYMFDPTIPLGVLIFNYMYSSPFAQVVYSAPGESMAAPDIFDPDYQTKYRTAINEYITLSVNVYKSLKELGDLEKFTTKIFVHPYVLFKIFTESTEASYPSIKEGASRIYKQLEGFKEDLEKTYEYFSK